MYAQSIQAGVKAIASLISEDLARCSSAKFLFVGYSQGALVIRLAQRPQSTLSVVLFGDPARRTGDGLNHLGEGIWEVLYNVPALTSSYPSVSFCNRGDAVCAFSLKPVKGVGLQGIADVLSMKANPNAKSTPHGRYESDGSVVVGAGVLAKAIRSLSPSLPPAAQPPAAQPPAAQPPAAQPPAAQPPAAQPPAVQPPPSTRTCAFSDYYTGALYSVPAGGTLTDSQGNIFDVGPNCELTIRPTSPPPPPPNPPPLGSLSYSLSENPFLCNSSSRVFGQITGAQPGETFSFSSPQASLPLRSGPADPNGVLPINWIAAGPSRGSGRVKLVQPGSYVTIDCYTRGETITDGGTSNIWNHLGDGSNGWIPDLYVLTGSNDPVVPQC
jgi:Cutinase